MDDKDSRKQTPHTAKSLTALLADAINLATYAVENGRLPEVVNLSDLYRMWETKVDKQQRISDEDINNLQYYYQVLEEELSPVSAISLRATDISHLEYGSNKNHLSTDAGRHAKRMWWMAFGILFVIISINLYQYQFHMNSPDWAQGSVATFETLTLLYWLAGIITPFAYGAFGAAVRMLRITEKRLRERSFDPRRTAEHLNRMVLGTLSGGVIVLVYSVGGVGDTDVKLTEAGLGFMAGYSIDLLFSILDRMVSALSPSQEEATRKTKVQSKITKKTAEVFTEKEIQENSESVVANVLSEANQSKPKKTTLA